MKRLEGKQLKEFFDALPQEKDIMVLSRRVEVWGKTNFFVI